MSIAVGVALAIMIAAALVYWFATSKESSAKFNGAAIVAAARDYTRDLKARKQPIPKSVTLEDLVEHHFLTPSQVEAFSGAKTTVMLTADMNDPASVLMRVHFADGTEFVLLTDGSVLQVPHK